MTEKEEDNEIDLERSGNNISDESFVASTIEEEPHNIATEGAQKRKSNVGPQRTRGKEHVDQKTNIKHGVKRGGKKYIYHRTCPHCDFETTCGGAANRLKLHIKSVHEQIKDIHCKLCDFSTTYKHKLTLHHKNVHLKTTDHSCKQCGYATNILDNFHVIIMMSNDRKYHIGLSKRHKKVSAYPQVIHLHRYQHTYWLY